MRALRVIAEVALLTSLAATISLLVAVHRSLKTMIQMFGAACPLVALVLTLTFSREGCDLESAYVMPVPPSSARIVALWTCGAITCWSRSLRLADGREVGATSMCDQLQGDKLQGPVAPTPTLPPT